MRALAVSCVALLAMGYSCYAQEQLRGVFGPPGSTPPAAKSGKSTLSAPNYGAVGNGPRVTVSGQPTQGQLLPNDVNPSPISDRPGYGTAIVNGRRAIIDLSSNRIVQVQD
jgi:hypothetical protein